MKIARTLLVAAFTVCFTVLATAQELKPVDHPENLGFSPARLQRLTDTYQGYVDRGELPGAVLLIARGNKIAYLQAIGYQDREKKTPMKADAIFRLASMTKPIVSVAAMMLVEEGRIDLLAPVSKYLPEFGRPEGRGRATDTVGKRTDADARAAEAADDGAGPAAAHLGPGLRPVRRRLVHQAYREAKVGDRGHTLAEMVTKLSKLPLAQQPGEVWEYSIVGRRARARRRSRVRAWSWTPSSPSGSPSRCGMTRPISTCTSRIWRAWPRHRSRRRQAPRVCRPMSRRSRTCCLAAAAWWRASAITCASAEMLLNGEYGDACGCWRRTRSR